MGEDLAPHLVCGRPCVSLEEGMATYSSIKGFPGSSARKESACNAGDPGPIRGSGRPTGEGKGYPLQYSGLENLMDYTVHGRTVNVGV